MPFLTHQFIQRVHALNELTANVLFAVAERYSLFGKAQRWGWMSPRWVMFYHNYLILLISSDGCSSFRCTSSSWRSLGGLLVAIDKRGDPIKLGFYCFFCVVLHSHIFSYCTQKWRRHMSLLSFKLVCLYTVQSCCSIFTVIIAICRLFPWY